MKLALTLEAGPAHTALAAHVNTCSPASTKA